MYIYKNNGYTSITRVNTRDIDPNNSSVSFSISIESSKKLAALYRGEVVLSQKEKREIRKEISKNFEKALMDFDNMVKENHMCKWLVANSVAIFAQGANK